MSVTIKPKFAPGVESDIFDAAFEGKSRREEEAAVMRAHLHERAKDCLAKGVINESLVSRHRYDTRSDGTLPGLFGLGIFIF